MDFMELAPYHPEVGYYRRSQPRIGTSTGTDFYTATSSGPIFGELVAAACAALIRSHGGKHEEYAFIEIGAENEHSMLDGVAHPFASVRTEGIGDPIALDGRCVLFSNELFDVQPCRRFVRRAGAWHEIGVAERAGQLTEIEIGAVSEPWLPTGAPEGYRFDAPRAASELAARIAAQPWHGLFVALDYGKSWAALAAETPAGTMRELCPSSSAKGLSGLMAW